MNWKPKLKVGDKVWYPDCGKRSVTKPCPICFGQKQVTLTLGNGDTVVLPCDYCGKGFDEPRGRIEEWEYVEGAKCGIISQIRVVITAQGEDREYHIDNQCFAETAFCDTEEAATAQAALKAARVNEEDMTRADRLKQNQLKSYSWNAGYHLREAKSHRKDAERHEKMAVLCKARSRESSE